MSSKLTWTDTDFSNWESLSYFEEELPLKFLVVELLWQLCEIPNCQLGQSLLGEEEGVEEGAYSL